jgi:uncharacterized protein DUF1194
LLRDRLLTRHQLRNTAAEAVDVTLVLAADSSGSISNEDRALQFRGNAAAVTSDVFIAGLRFAATLLHAPGPSPGFTSIGGGIDFARQTLSACRFAADWKLIDVSGDGTANDGRPITEAREEAVAAGIAINGLPIVRREPDIAGYYSRNVIGGDSAFLLIATDVSSFHTAGLEQFVTEIALVGAKSRSG